MAISSRHLFLGCFTIRLIYASIARTAFAPDEFWQGPEVAHQMVFGYVKFSRSVVKLPLPVVILSRDQVKLFNICSFLYSTGMGI